MLKFNNVYKHLTIPMALLLILFTFLNLLFKFYYLPQESIYGDEGYSIFHAQKPLSELTDVFLHDQNPPLHILLLHFWMQIFGVSDISAKALSVILSVLCGGVLFLFANKFLNKQAAIVVSVLFLFSNPQLFYSHEIRTYALVQLLCIASFYFYFKLLKEPDKKTIAMLTIINLLLLFSHYLTIFIFITQFICVWMFYKQNKKSVWYYIISQLFVALIFLPWLKVLFANLPESGSFWLAAPNWGELKWFMFMLNGNEWLFIVFSTIILSSLLMVILNKRFLFFSEDFNVKYYIVFLCLYLLPIALDYWVAQYTPVFLGRYFLYSTLGLFLLIAYVLSNLSAPSTIRILIFTPVIYFLITSFNAKPEKEDDWKSFVPKVKSMQTEKTVIYISATYKYKEFSFYYDREAFKDYKNTISRLYEEDVFCSKEGPWGWNKINLDNIDQVLFVQSHSQFEDPEETIKQSLLNNHFKICSEFSKINITLTVFKKDSLPCYPVKITKEIKASKCDFWDISTGVLEQTENAVTIYKTNMDLDSTCPLPHLITTEKSRSGKYSCKINKQDQYSIGIIKSLKELNERRELNISAFVNYDLGADVRLVVSVEKQAQVFYRQELIVSEKSKNPNEWAEITFSAIIPEGVVDDAEVKIYFWNPSKMPAFIDDFAVQLHNENNSTRTTK